MSAALTRERLIELLDVYGADLSVWEPDARSAAQALIDAGDDAFLLAQAQARLLDDLLATDAVAPASIELEAAILNAAPTPSSARFGRSRFTDALLPRWASAAGMAVALLAGAGVGYAQTSAENELAVTDAVLSYADISGDWATYDAFTDGAE